MSDLFRAERDTIAGLGLLAANYVRFDPPLVSPAGVSHVRGFNVFCIIVDNIDGEVLAIDQNQIHGTFNPLQHAEQVGVRNAIDKLHVKRPKPVDMPVETYYKQRLFMAPGTAAGDYVNKGCTLYNTFDPCGMCAVTLLVCYMKRIAYLFEDAKFDGVYESMRKYFKNRESIKEPLALIEVPAENLSPLQSGAQLIDSLRKKVHSLEESGTPLVMTLDQCREELSQATRLLMQIHPEHLQTTGTDRDRNLRTLSDVKQICNLQ